MWPSCSLAILPPSLQCQHAIVVLNSRALGSLLRFWSGLPRRTSGACWSPGGWPDFASCRTLSLQRRILFGLPLMGDSGIPKINKKEGLRWYKTETNRKKGIFRNGLRERQRFPWLSMWSNILHYYLYPSFCLILPTLPHSLTHPHKHTHTHTHKHTFPCHTIATSIHSSSPTLWSRSFHICNNCYAVHASKYAPTHPTPTGSLSLSLSGTSTNSVWAYVMCVCAYVVCTLCVRVCVRERNSEREREKLRERERESESLLLILLWVFVCMCCEERVV